METFIEVLKALAILIPILLSIRESTSKTGKKVDVLENKLNSHIKDDADSKAKSLRVRILRFDDELYQGVKHSENHFEDILDDIDAYKAYCDAHPDFHNSRGSAAMKHIQQIYEKCKQEHSFIS